MLSRFLDGITYRCFAHADVEALASSSSVPVINALSDRHHPCQAAADLMTILELGRDPREERVAWVGDGNNVLHDLMLAASVLGIDLAYAVPEGYEPDAPVVERASALAPSRDRPSVEPRGRKMLYRMRRSSTRMSSSRWARRD